MSNTKAAAPTLLAPYLANETTALRYENSLTLLNLHGNVDRAEGQEAYSLIVSRDGGTFRVTWNVQVLEPASICNTVRLSYWRKGAWRATFRSQRAAEAFAAEKLAALRAWGAKRAALAA
jgi:hypothetical protein